MVGDVGTFFFFFFLNLSPTAVSVTLLITQCYVLCKYNQQIESVAWEYCVGLTQPQQIWERIQLKLIRTVME